MGRLAVAPDIGHAAGGEFLLSRKQKRRILGDATHGHQLDRRTCHEVIVSCPAPVFCSEPSEPMSGAVSVTSLPESVRMKQVPFVPGLSLTPFVANCVTVGSTTSVTQLPSVRKSAAATDGSPKAEADDIVRTADRSVAPLVAVNLPLYAVKSPDRM